MKGWTAVLWLAMAAGIAVLPRRTEAYRILGIFPFCSKSHNMMFEALTKGLSERGHRVDIVTCFPPRRPIANVTVIMNVEDTQERFVNNWDFEKAVSVGKDPLPLIALEYGNKLCEILASPEIQGIVRNPPSDPPYDLVIVEAFGANCFIGLGAFYEVPVVLASTTVEFPWINRALDNPSSTAFYPSFFTGFVHPMSFWTRVKNSLIDAFDTYRYQSMTGETQTELMRRHLRPDIPHIRELEKNVALALINSYHSLTGVRPTTSGLIEVGGLHIEDNRAELSEELRNWLDESTDGVVYFTLGSMVNIETMPNDTIKGLYAAFSRISPIRVLMKVADRKKLLPGLPDNVVTSSWIPQVPVLAHNNTRVFITHGGLMGTQESLYHGVPLIGIPLFADQGPNIMNYARKGMAIKLDFNNIEEQTMYAALDSVLNDPSYREAAKYQSALFRDRPMRAIDTATYWIEYAIRNGANVLHSPGNDLDWWQVALLDVYGFLLVAAVATLFLLLLLLKFAVRSISQIVAAAAATATKYSGEATMKRRTKRD